MKRLLFFLLISSALLAQTEKESQDFSYALKLYDQEFFDLAASQFVNFYKYFPNSSKAPEARYYAGMSFFQRNLYEKSRIEFQALALQYPKSNRAPEGWYKAGECSALLKNYNEAVKAFGTIRLLYSKSPFAPAGLFEAGKMHLQNNEPSKAWHNFSVIIERYKNSVVYYKTLTLAGRSLFLLNEPEQAKKFAYQLLEGKAEENLKASAYLLLAAVHEGQGYISAACENYNKIISGYTESDAFGQAVLEISRIYFKEKKYEAIRKTLSKGLSKEKDKKRTAEMHSLLGDVNFMQKKFALAADEYKQAQNASADSVQFILDIKLALSNKKQGLGDRALKNLENSLEAYPDKKSNLYHAAHKIYLQWLESEGHHERVFSILSARLRSADQDGFDHILHIAKILSRLERWRDIIQILQPYTFSQRRFAEKDDIFYYLAQANEKLSRFDESAYLYQKLITDMAASDFYERAVSRLEYLNNFKIVRKDIAVNKLADVIARQINGAKKPDLLFELGKVYFDDLKDYKKAEANFKLALNDSLSEQLGDVFFFLGKTYLKLAEETGQTEQYSQLAEEYLKKAANLETNSNYRDQASWLLVKTLLQKNKIPLEKEKNYLEALINKFPKSALTEEWYSYLAFALAFDSGYVDDSIKYFKILIESYKQSKNYPGYLYGYAQLLVEDHAQEAIELFKELALSHFYAHESANALHEVAVYYEQNEQFSEANVLYTKLVDQYYYCDLAEEVKNNLGLILAKAGRYEQAIPELEREINSPFINDFILSANFLSEQRFQKIYFLATAYNAKHKFNKAAQMYRLFLSLAASSALSDQARFELALIYFNNGRKEMALENFLALSDKKTEIYLNANKYAAEIYFKKGQYAKAGALYQKLAGLNTAENDRQYLNARYIISLIRQGKIKSGQTAIKKFKKSYSRAYNQFALFSVELGNYYRLNKNFKKAQDMFRQVKKKYAKTEYADDADYFLAVTYVTLNKVEDAFKILSGFYNNYKNSNRLSAALNTLGNIYFRSEKYDNAISMFKNALQYNKDKDLKVNIMSNLIKTYTMTGFWDAAQATAREYVKEFPYAADRLEKEIIIARAHINLNQFQDAVEYLKEIKLRADAEREPEIQFYIGEALLKAGQYENAIAEFVKIPLLSRKTKLQWEASALYYSGQSYEKLGRTADAVRMYKEIIRRPGIDLVLKKDAEKRIKQIQ